MFPIEPGKCCVQHVVVIFFLKSEVGEGLAGMGDHYAGRCDSILFPYDYQCWNGYEVVGNTKLREIEGGGKKDEFPDSCGMLLGITCGHQAAEA